MAINLETTCGPVKNYPRCKCNQEQYDLLPPKLAYLIDKKQYILKRSDYADFITDKNG